MQRLDISVGENDSDDMGEEQGAEWLHQDRKTNTFSDDWVNDPFVINDQTIQLSLTGWLYLNLCNQSSFV